MWRKYKGSRRYKTKLFDRDYDNGGGEELRHEVAKSLMSAKKKLNGHDIDFLDHLGYEIIDADSDHKALTLNLALTLNDHFYYPATWGYKEKQPLKDKSPVFLDVAEEMSIYFENNPLYIAFTLLSPIPQVFLDEMPEKAHLYNIRFKSNQHEIDFLSDMRIIIKKNKVIKYTELARRLRKYTNTSYSYTYLVWYLSDKA